MLVFAFVFPLIAVVAIVLLAAAKRGPFRLVQIVPAGAVTAESANRRVRMRNTAAIVAALIFATTVSIGLLSPARTTAAREFVDPITVILATPVLTAVVFVVFFAFVPAFREILGSRTAELDRRTPLTFGPRSVFLAPVIAAVLLVILVLAFGIMADSSGRMLFYSPDGDLLGSYSGFFPGVTYTGPVLLAVALLTGAVIVALRRITAAPRPSDGSLREADSAMRLLAIRVVMKSSTTALTVTTAILLIYAGIGATDPPGGTRTDGRGTVIPADATVHLIGTLGTIALWLGPILIVAALVFLVSALSDATRRPFAVPRPETVPA